MNFSINKISSRFFFNISLLISVFLFTGYNQAILAGPLESTNIELVLSERFEDHEVIYTGEFNTVSLPTIYGIDAESAATNLSEIYSNYSDRVVKTQSNFFQDFKTNLSKLLFSLKQLGTSPSEDSQI